MQRSGGRKPFTREDSDEQEDKPLAHPLADGVVWRPHDLRRVAGPRRLRSPGVGPTRVDRRAVRSAVLAAVDIRARRERGPPADAGDPLLGRAVVARHRDDPPADGRRSRGPARRRSGERPAGPPDRRRGLQEIRSGADLRQRRRVAQSSLGAGWHLGPRGAGPPPRHDAQVTVPPARPVRQRQLAGAGGGAGRRERDRAARRHGTRRGRARAAPGSLVGAAACRRLGRFAGLAIATPQPLPGRRAVRSRRGARAADAPAPRCDRGANPTPVREPAHVSTETGDRAAERRMGHHRGRPAEPFLRDRLHRQGPVRPGQRGEGLLISGGGASRKASRGVAGRAAPPPVSRFQELPMMRETEGGMYVQEDDNLIFAGLADPTGPFGNPDGSRAPIENILDQFVDFRGNPAFGALATRPDDATTRVIVGRLGAGKTVYLRRLRNFQARQDSVFADHPQQNLPSTEAIVKACQWFPEQFLTEKWMQVWSRAVLSALSTHLLAHEELRPYVTHEQAESIRSDYGHLLGAFRRPRSIYGELRTIINGQNTGRQLTNHLEDPAWDDLEDVLATMLRTCPPIFFYLDAVDEEFSHAPMYWLRCQKGLFYQVMRFLRDPRLGGRLHIVVSIRDIVMSAVYRSEHAPRYYDEPHIRILGWTKDSIEYLLLEKLRRLDRSYFMAPENSAHPVEAWLGTPVVSNQSRGVHERVTDYLLRHTRLIPRDVVSLGNAICAEIVRQKAAGRSEMPQADLRRVVARAAKRFGDSQLAQASNQVAADTMPKDAARNEYTEVYTSTLEYLTGIDQQIRDIIREVGRDRFSREELELVSMQADGKFDSSTSLPSVLWQNGLLGYVEAGGEARFYSQADTDQFNIPMARGYVFHPCVVESVGIDGVGDPVYPFRRT